MSTAKIKVTLVNGSLRGEEATSLALLKDLQSRMLGAGYDVRSIHVKAQPSGRYPDKTLGAMSQVEAIVLAFPLHSYTIPGALTRLLEDYSSYFDSGLARYGGARVYAVVNCAFHDPRINREALRVIRNFSARVGFNYRFSVALGCGPVTVMTKKLPLMNIKLKRAFAAIVEDIQARERRKLDDIYIKPIVPKKILNGIKGWYEKKSPGLSLC